MSAIGVEPLMSRKLLPASVAASAALDPLRYEYAPTPAAIAASTGPNPIPFKPITIHFLHFSLILSKSSFVSGVVSV